MDPLDTLRYADSLLLGAHAAGAAQRSAILTVVALLAALVVALVVLVLIILARQRSADRRTQALLADLAEQAHSAKADAASASALAAKEQAVANEARESAALLREQIGVLSRLTRVPPADILPPDGVPPAP